MASKDNIELGQTTATTATTARGRMDQQHWLHGDAPKRIVIYSLAADAARQLREA